MALTSCPARQGQQRSLRKMCRVLSWGLARSLGSAQPWVARSASCTALFNQYAHGMISGRRCDRGREPAASDR